MDAELIALRARVETLERAQHGATRSLLPFVSVVVMVTSLVVGTPIVMRAGGPTQVTAPFTVVDGSGRVLLKVEAQPGRGAIVSFYNEGGRSVVQAGGSPSGCCGWVGVFGDDSGKPRAQLAVQYNDKGVVRLSDDGDMFAQVTSEGFAVRNGATKSNLASLSAWSDGGYLRLRNGKDAVSAEFMGTDDGGIIELNNAPGKRSVRLEGLEAGKLSMFGNGVERMTVGVSADDAGLIRLYSTKGSSTMLHGNGVIRTVNPAGKEVIDLGIDPSGNGILDVRNKSAEGGVRLEVAPDGAGTVKIHTPPFDIKAQMGVKEGGKGDVCVEGSRGLICLSGIAIKNFIPW